MSSEDSSVDNTKNTQSKTSKKGTKKRKRDTKEDKKVGTKSTTTKKTKVEKRLQTLSQRRLKWLEKARENEDRLLKKTRDESEKVTRRVLQRGLPNGISKISTLLRSKLTDWSLETAENFGRLMDGQMTFLDTIKLSFKAPGYNGADTLDLVIRCENHGEKKAMTSDIYLANSSSKEDFARYLVKYAELQDVSNSSFVREYGKLIIKFLVSVLVKEYASSSRQHMEYPLIDENHVHIILDRMEFL